MPMPNIPNYLLYFRDDMRLSTWILWGACLQSALVVCLPISLAILPAIVVLVSRIAVSTLQIYGLVPHDGFKNVLKGRMTAQIPNEDGSFPEKAGDKDVVVFIIATRSNHAQGRFAPGLNEITDYFRKMWQELGRNREKWGYLGKTPTLIATEEDCTNTLVWISYWKSLEDLHAFARSDVHRVGWEWYNEKQKEYPHIGIQHEVYYAPRGHWENIAYNFRPFGLGQTKHVTKDGKTGTEGQRVISPLQPAIGPKWRSMKGRMARSEAA